eukprot:TRINITY_DN16675_c0_g1_i1.p1 TRINITY_DN16675_c0_g1~~TRINITY_DN16675_c0_g1_i1.p1  ORF type:complete len:665 (-),score=179.58 TRINITY_DN16675_c0_g1_i1:144-2138(-)
MATARLHGVSPRLQPPVVSRLPAPSRASSDASGFTATTAGAPAMFSRPVLSREALEKSPAAPSPMEAPAESRHACPGSWRASPLELHEEVADRHQHQQILDLVENLQRELARSEREKAVAEQKLVDAQAHISQLRMELEQSNRRSSELERLTHSGQSASDAFTENGDLRKQLSAYATEIERLRSEKESQDASIADAQQEFSTVLRRLSAEKDQLLQERREFEKKHRASQEERDRLESMHGKTQEHCQHLESQLQLRGEAAEAHLEAAQASMQEELDKASASLHEAQQSHRQKDVRVNGLVEIVNDTMAIVTELQESYVEQTKAYQHLSKCVRAEQEELLKDVLEAEQLALHSEQFAGELRRHLGHAKDMSSAGEEMWKAEAGRLQNQLHQLTEHHRASADTVRSFQQADQQRKAEGIRLAEQEKKTAIEKAALLETKAAKRKQRHVVMSNPNISKQMVQALDGIQVEKIDQKGRREPRSLKVVCSIKSLRERGAEQRMPDFQLRWAKAPFKEFPDRSSCDLAQVISIGYGFAARACWLYQGKVAPECCFSVNTPMRSFDFICREEWHAEVMVLAISRLCTRIQGWPIHGGVGSHSRFQALKGWTKVQSTCRKRNHTLVTHVLEASAKSGRSRPPPPTHTLPGPMQAEDSQEEADSGDESESEED